MLGTRGLEESQSRPPPYIVNPLGVVVSYGVSNRRYVGYRQHLLIPKGSSQCQPKTAGVKEVVHSGLEVPEPTRLRHPFLIPLCDSLRLYVTLYLLTSDRIVLEPVELYRLRPWR